MRWQGLCKSDQPAVGDVRNDDPVAAQLRLADLPRDGRGRWRAGRERRRRRGGRGARDRGRRRRGRPGRPLRRGPHRCVADAGGGCRDEHGPTARSAAELAGSAHVPVLGQQQRGPRGDRGRAGAARRSASWPGVGGGGAL